MIDCAPRRRRIAGLMAAAGIALLIAGMLAFYALAGFFDRDPVWFFPARPPTGDFAAVLYSSDLGFRIGTTGTVAKAIAAEGIPVIGLNTPALFGARKTRAQVNALFVHDVRLALARTGASRVIVVGGSFGADIARTGLAGLPTNMRGKIAGALLMAPGKTVYFGADPLGVRYLRSPDLGPQDARSLSWLPVECVQGAEERDSLCPTLDMPNVRSTVLPGGHYLYRHMDLMLQTVRAAIARIRSSPRTQTSA